jgi:NDP-sugar pyrophosphorylase family protein
VRRAIILAGGKGTRLLPYTVVIPKPMLPIGDVPVIEIISRQLKYFGFDEVVVSLGHLSDIIRVFLESKSGDEELPKFHFYKETSSLGTSGSIREINLEDDNFAVINGDILTTLDIKKMFDEHCRQNAILTIGIRKTEYQLPLGSITTDEDGYLQSFTEKPKLTFLDNIGAYIYSKNIYKYMEPNTKLDVNVLVQILLSAGEKIFTYRNDGPYFWIDIGTHADYERANKEFSLIRDQFPFIHESWNNHE